MSIEARKVSEVTEMMVAIVRFGPPTENDGLRAGEYYQVCVNPFHFSPCGQFVRFGAHQGDEIMGWQRADQIYVVAELAKIKAGQPENQIQIPWGNSPALEPPAEEVIQ